MIKVRARHHWVCYALLGFAVAACNGSPGEAPLAETPSPLVGTGGEPIRFVEGFQRGWEAARDQGKPMLIFFTAQWCDLCHALEREAFCLPSIVRLAEQFTCVQVDADAEPDICRQFRVRNFPTIQFLSPRGLPLNRVTGKQPTAQLEMEMQAALQAVALRVDEPGSPRAR